MPPGTGRVTVHSGREGGGAIYSTIVVGTDGSATAEVAMARAIDLARLASATLHVVTVADPGPAPAAPAPSTRADFPAEVALESALERLGTDDLDVEQHVITGEPATEIVVKAGAPDVQLLGPDGWTPTWWFWAAGGCAAPGACWGAFPTWSRTGPPATC